jgi:hypothetical protein
VHQREVAPALARVELEVLHRLDEAGDDRQRRLQLVRDVADEVAPHARDLLDLRHVVRQQQRLSRAERHQLQRQHAPPLAHHGHADRFGEIACRDVGVELRLAHQVDDRLAAVLREVEPELLAGARVRPFDRVVLVEHDDAVGDGFRGATEPVDHRSKIALVGGTHAHPPVDRREHLAPRTDALGDRGVERARGPAPHQVLVPQVGRDDDAGTDREDEQRRLCVDERPREPGGRRDRERRGERGPRPKGHRGAAIR